MRITHAMAFACMAALTAGRAGAAGAPTYAELVAGIADSTVAAVDLNGDGVPDVLRTFAADGSVASIRVDHDFDGRFDIEAERTGETVRMSEDRNRDGRVDYREIRPAGSLAPYARLEWRDDDGDGFEEAWASEELDPTGRLIVREERVDLDRDGAFDRMEKTTRARFLADGGDGGFSEDPEATGGMCIDNRAELEALGDALALQVDAIARLNAVSGAGTGAHTGPRLIALRFGIQMGVSCNTRALAVPMRREIERSVTEGFKCLAVNNLPLMVRFLVFLVTQRPEVHCLDPSGFAAKAGELLEREENPRDPNDDEREDDSSDHHGPSEITSDASQLCGLGEVNGRRSWISTQAFDPRRGCLPVAGVVFHEFLHNMGVGTSARHLPTDLHDGVYGCQRTCFPAPGVTTNPAQIAACQAAR